MRGPPLVPSSWDGILGRSGHSASFDRPAPGGGRHHVDAVRTETFATSPQVSIPDTKVRSGLFDVASRKSLQFVEFVAGMCSLAGVGCLTTYRLWSRRPLLLTPVIPRA